MYVDYKELGQRIANRRKKLGLKQYQVNERAGLSDKYLSNIERASSVLSVDVLMKLCGALETTPNELLLGTTSVNDSINTDFTVNDLISKMTDEQKKIAISMLKWILTQELSTNSKK